MDRLLKSIKKKSKGKQKKVEVDAAGMKMLRVWEEAKRRGPPKAKPILEGITEEQLRGIKITLNPELKELFKPGFRQYTTPCELKAPEWLNYNRKKLEESGGFDVGDDVPHDITDLPFKPIQLDDSNTLMDQENYSSCAIDRHNKEHNTKYQFEKVLEANIGGRPGLDIIDLPVKPIPLDDSKTLMDLEKYSSCAIDQHNKEHIHNTKYQFEKVLDGRPGQVRDMARAGSPTLNFPAEVRAASGEATVVMYSEPEP